MLGGMLLGDPPMSVGIPQTVRQELGDESRKTLAKDVEVQLIAQK